MKIGKPFRGQPVALLVVIGHFAVLILCCVYFAAEIDLHNRPGHPGDQAFGPAYLYRGRFQHNLIFRRNIFLWNGKTCNINLDWQQLGAAFLKGEGYCRGRNRGDRVAAGPVIIYNQRHFVGSRSGDRGSVCCHAHVFRAVVAYLVLFTIQNQGDQRIIPRHDFQHGACRDIHCNRNALDMLGDFRRSQQSSHPDEERDED